MQEASLKASLNILGFREPSDEDAQKSREFHDFTLSFVIEINRSASRP